MPSEGQDQRHVPVSTFSCAKAWSSNSQTSSQNLTVTPSFSASSTTPLAMAPEGRTSVGAPMTRIPTLEVLLSSMTCSTTSSSCSRDATIRPGGECKLLGGGMSALVNCSGEFRRIRGLPGDRLESARSRTGSECREGRILRMGDWVFDDRVGNS